MIRRMSDSPTLHRGITEATYRKVTVLRTLGSGTRDSGGCLNIAGWSSWWLVTLITSRSEVRVLLLQQKIGCVAQKVRAADC